MEHILRKLEHESLREAYFLTVALILAFGMLQTTGTALNTDKPVVSVVSCSMYPALGVGDVLLVYGEDYEDIEVGEVVVYDIKEATISVNDEEFFLKDYNGDEPAETDAGRIEISRIMQDRTGRAVGAVLLVDGREVVLREGEAVQVNSQTVELQEAVGMNIPVVHRVESKSATHLETKGDNNNDQLAFEDNVKPEQIHGTMFFKIPKVGGLKLLAMDLVGFSGDRPLVIDTYPACTDKT